MTEVTDLVKPTDKTVDLVYEWLEDNGIQMSRLECSAAKYWIKISLPINAIENLLDRQYSVFQQDDGDYLVRTPEWTSACAPYMEQSTTPSNPTAPTKWPSKISSASPTTAPT